MTTNLLYHCSIESLGWLSSKAEEEWRIHKYDHGWWQILLRIWHSKLPLVAKVFISRVLIGGLPYGIALKLWVIAFLALFKWRTILIDLYNVRLLVRFGVTFLKFGKFYHGVI